jgi:hypothetical protein
VVFDYIKKKDGTSASPETLLLLFDQNNIGMCMCMCMYVHSDLTLLFVIVIVVLFPPFNIKLCPGISEEKPDFTYHVIETLLPNAAFKEDAGRGKLLELYATSSPSPFLSSEIIHSRTPSPFPLSAHRGQMGEVCSARLHDSALLLVTTRS